MKIFDKITDKLMHQLQKRAFMKSVLLVAGGTAFAQLIAILITPVLSRLFTPGDFGVLALYTSALSILSPFATLKYDLAIPLEKDEKGAINVFFLSIVCIIIFSSIVLVIVLLFAGAFSRMLNAEEFEPFMWLLPIGTATIGLYTTSLHLALYYKSYRSITKTKIAQGIARSTTQVGFGGVGFGGPLGLILGEIAGQAWGFRTLTKPFFGSVTFSLKNVTIRDLSNAAKKYRKFPLISSPSTLLQGIGLQVSTFLLSALYGTEVTGSFGFAQRIIAAPLMLIGTAIGQVYFAEGARLIREDPDRFYRLTLKTSKRLFTIGGIIAGILIPFGPFLFEIVFGEPWRVAGEFSRILALMLMIRFVVFPISSALVIIEKQGLQFLLDLPRSILVILAIYFSKILGFDAYGAIMNYTVAMIVVYVTTYIVIMKKLRQLSSLRQIQ